MTVNESLRAKYELDIEQLDYKYVGNCDSPKVLEKILMVLRSGQEGVYPDLVRFTEERLRKFRPNSSLLRTDQPATPLRSLDPDARQELLSDLKQWKSEVKAIDEKLKSNNIEEVRGKESKLPPVRGTVEVKTVTEKLKSISQEPQEKPARIASYDYAAWDRYDVEAQLKLIDDDEKPSVQKPREIEQEHSDPAIDDQPPVQGLNEAERAALALREKQKGNEYFRSGDFSRAAIYYTRSIHASATVAAYNNRAQANLKLGKHGSALMDCTYVLRREPKNVKALIRRGMARQMAKDWMKARLDFQQVLDLEPHNLQAKKHMEEVEKAIISSDTNRKKIMIQEVDSIEEHSVKTNDSVHTKVGAQVNASTAATLDQTEQDKEHIKVQQKAKCKDEKGVYHDKATKKENIKIEVVKEEEKKNITMKSEEESSATGNSKLFPDRATTSTNYTQHTSPPSASPEASSDLKTASSKAQICSQKNLPPEAPAEPQLLKETMGQCEPQPRAQASTEPMETPSETHPKNLPTTPSMPPGGPEAASATPAASQQRPWKTFEFMSRWRSLRSCNSLAPYVGLLRSVAPHQISSVFGSELDASVLSIVIRCVLDVMLAEDGPVRCQELLEHLSSAARFHVVKLLLDRRDQERLARIAEKLQRMGADVSLLTRRFMQ